MCVPISNGNDMETKANLNFYNSVFFYSDETRSVVRKLVLKRSERIQEDENYFQSKANMYNSKKIICKVKQTHMTVFGSEPAKKGIKKGSGMQPRKM